MPSRRRARRALDDTSFCDLSDATLLARFAVSDPAASAAFVERFQRRVFGVAFTILGDRRAAEDAAQEAFLRAWRNAAVFDSRRGSVITWLLTITRNVAIDSIRVRRPMALAPDDPIVLSIAASGRDPADVIAVQDDVSWLHEALAGLPDEQRRAVVLAGMWGLSARDISEREAIPLGTAKTRIRIALRRLRVAQLRDARERGGGAPRSRQESRSNGVAPT